MIDNPIQELSKSREGLNIPFVSNESKVADLATSVRYDPAYKYLMLSGMGWKASIPQHGIILDLGCFDGRVGMWMTAKRECSLIQADIRDGKGRLGYGQVPFILVNKETPPCFSSGVKVDSVLLVDVLHHVGYGHDWDPETRTVDEKGKTEDMRLFLKGAATALNESGKLLIITTHPTGEFVDKKCFQEAIKSDPEIGGKVLFFPDKTKQ